MGNGAMKLRHLIAVVRFPAVAGINRRHVIQTGIAAQVMTNEERKARNLPHDSTRAMERRVRQRERAEAKRAKQSTGENK